MEEEDVDNKEIDNDNEEEDHELKKKVINLSLIVR